MVQLIELGNRSLLEVLRFFIRNPSTKISYTALRKKIKAAKATLTKHLGFLLSSGFIRVEKIGMNKIYELNKENSIVKQLKILDTLLTLNELELLGRKYDICIYLYGSASRGEDAEQSDIDLLIIGKIKKEQILPQINGLSKKIGRNIKLVIFTQVDWSQMSRNDAAFYERVEKDKIRLR